jgi:hypothetical protein
VPKLPGGSGVPLSAITSKSVLLVEGNDEKGFFEALAKHMKLEIGRDIELRLVYGKGNYRDQFQAFLNDPGFPYVEAYGIVRDADNSAQNAVKSIQDMLKKAGQPCPTNHALFAYDAYNRLKTGIFIMPGNTNTGMLEDLCLQSVQDHPIMPFVDEYIKNVKQQMQADAPKNERKARMQTFLAGMKDTIPYLGVAAGKGYWDFTSTALYDLRTFISELTSNNYKAVS